MEIRLLWNLGTIKDPAAASPGLPLLYKPSTVFVKPLYSERQELFCQHLYCMCQWWFLNCSSYLPLQNLSGSWNFPYEWKKKVHGRSIFTLILHDFVAI
jgi:hypothetical protein